MKKRKMNRVGIWFVLLCKEVDMVMQRSFKKYWFISLVLVLPSVLLAQATMEWVVSYDGENREDVGYALAVGNSGNVYVTGYSYDSLPHTSGALFLKYDSGGNELWSFEYDSPTEFRDIVLDAAENVYIAGREFITTKFDSSGNQLWSVQHVDSGLLPQERAIAIDGSGNVYVTGFKFYANTEYDIITIKYDNNGNELWVRQYDGNSSFNHDDFAFDLVCDNTGNVYVTGSSWRTTTMEDYVTIKYDSSGSELWISYYDGPKHTFPDCAEALALDNLGNIYVTGYSADSVTGQDYATIKYDSDGNELWVNRYSGPGDNIDRAHAIALDSSKNVYVTGESNGATTYSDYATIKYDTDGNELWVARYDGGAGGIASDQAFAIALDNTGNVYVTGAVDIDSSTSQKANYGTIKYDVDGNELWVATYDGTDTTTGYNNDLALAIAVNNGKVYVTGCTGEQNQRYDCTTIKYSQIVGCTENQPSPKNYQPLLRISPNPFSKLTKISFGTAHGAESISATQYGGLKIYDATGRLVKDFSLPTASSSMSTVSWDGTDNSGKRVASGVYFLRFEAGDIALTKKLLFLR